MTRFVFTGPWYHTNQRYAAKALVDAGHEVTFLVLRRGSKEVFDEFTPDVRLVVGKSAGKDHIEEGAPPFIGLWRQLRNLNPDVVVVREHGHPYAPLATVVARLLGCRVLFYKLTPVHRKLGWWKRTQGSLSAWVASAKWTSPLLGSPALHPPAFGALRYVPFVMEAQTSPIERLWFRGGVLNCLCVATFRPRKSHRLLLEAIAGLSHQYAIQTTIIGECVSEDHQRHIDELKVLRDSLGLTDKLRFRTNLPYSEVQQEYAMHDLFVLPSRDEPAGIALLEAMAHSLPVICSDTCGLQSCVHSGENGYVFKSDDAEDLQECIERIVSNRVRLVEMGRRSYDIVVAEHSPEEYVKSMLELAGHGGDAPP